MLIYNENDIFNNNIKNAKLIIDTFDKFIEKLNLENKESFIQKVKYKKNKDDIINNFRSKFDYIDNSNTFKTIKSENIGFQNIKNDKKDIKEEIIKNNELNSLKMKNENEEDIIKQNKNNQNNNKMDKTNNIINNNGSKLIENN